MFKFLPGIILVQLITAVMVVTAFNWAQDFQLTIVIALFCLIAGLLAAFWFAYLARDMYQQDLQQVLSRHALEREKILLNAEKEKAGITAEQTKLQERHAREREQLLVNAEREKAQVVSESFQQMEKAIRKAQARANFKVGAAFTLAATAGGVMLFSQLITVGMMVLIGSGSGLAGYLARARQERLARVKRAENELKLLEHQSVNPPPRQERS